MLLSNSELGHLLGKARPFYLYRLILQFVTQRQDNILCPRKNSQENL